MYAHIEERYTQRLGFEEGGREGKEKKKKEGGKVIKNLAKIKILMVVSELRVTPPKKNQPLIVDFPLSKEPTNIFHLLWELLIPLLSNQT